MKRLGYEGYVAQGGDWGAIITDMLGVQAPAGLLGIHSNMAGVVPPDVSTALAQNALGAGPPPPAGLSDEGSRTYEQLNFFFAKGVGYGVQMGTRPQTMCREHLRARDLQGPAQLGRAGLPQPHVLQRGDRGNHFAAWQEPTLFTAELRAAFRSLR